MNFTWADDDLPCAVGTVLLLNHMRMVALYDEEELVFVVMVVPKEVTLEL